MRRKVEETRPLDYSELRRNCYGVQNMLMDQFNHPKFYYDGDFTASDYSDRFPQEMYHELLKKHFGANSGSWEFAPQNRGKMKAFLEELYQREITGYRVVRYTNSGGFPIYRFDVFSKSPDTPNEQIFTGQEAEDFYLEHGKNGELSNRRRLHRHHGGRYLDKNL